MSTNSPICITRTTGAVLTMHIQLVQLSTHGTRLGKLRDEAKPNSVEKAGALEVKAGLEVCEVHLARLVIRFIENRFFVSPEFVGFARLCKSF